MRGKIEDDLAAFSFSYDFEKEHSCRSECKSLATTLIVELVPTFFTELVRLLSHELLIKPVTPSLLLVFVLCSDKDFTNIIPILVLGAKLCLETSAANFVFTNFGDLGQPVTKYFYP